MRFAHKFGFTLVLLFCVPLILAQSNVKVAHLTVTRIDVPGSSDTNLSGINNNGVIVGSFDFIRGPDWHSFTWSNYFDVPNALFTIARGINDTDQIVGYYGLNNSESPGFIYDGQAFITVQYPGATSTTPDAINNVGLVVGYWFPVVEGFRFNGSQFRLIVVPGSLLTMPRGVNNLQDVVGTAEVPGNTYEGFLYSGGKFKILNFPGATSTVPSGINDSRIVVGAYIPQQRPAGLFLLEEQQIYDL